MSNERQQMSLDLFVLFLFSPIKIGEFDFEKKCEELAQRTDGFSGREIAKLLAACQVRLLDWNSH